MVSSTQIDHLCGDELGFIRRLKAQAGALADARLDANLNNEPDASGGCGSAPRSIYARGRTRDFRPEGATCGPGVARETQGRGRCGRQTARRTCGLCCAPYRAGVVPKRKRRLDHRKRTIDWPTSGRQTLVAQREYEFSALKNVVNAQAFRHSRKTTRAGDFGRWPRRVSQ